MKKKMTFLFLGLLSVVSMAESRTVYVMVSSDLDINDVKVSGIVRESSTTEKQFDEGGIVAPDADEKITVSVAEASEYEAYAGTKYIKLEIDELENTDEVKFVLGYPLEGKEIPTYNVIASEDIKYSTVGGQSLEEVFNSETRPMEDLVDSSDYDYDSFPGRELERDTRISGVVIGEQEMDSSTLPSNIIDIFSKNGELEDTINKVNGGAEINPNNSNKNSEFELWAVKTDKEGNIEPKRDGDGNIIYKRNQDGSYALDEEGNKIPDSERVLLYTSKDSGENPLYGDLRSIKKKDVKNGQQLFVGDKTKGDPYSHFVYDIDVRFKGSGTININNQSVSFGQGNKKWQFYNVENATLTFNGGNSFYFGLKGDEVGIVPPSGSNPSDIPLPVAEEFYAIDDTGEVKEREVDILSKYENTVKTRKSSVKMKVMTKSGSDEKNYEIEDMEE